MSYLWSGPNIGGGGWIGRKRALGEYDLDDSDLCGVSTTRGHGLYAGAILYNRDQLQAKSIAKRARVAQAKKNAEEAAAKAKEMALKKEQALEEEHGGKEGLQKWREDQAEIEKKAAAKKRMVELRNQLSMCDSDGKYTLPSSIPDMIKTQLKKDFRLTDKDIAEMPVAKKTASEKREKLFYNAHVVMAKMAEKYGTNALEAAKAALWPSSEHVLDVELGNLERRWPAEAEKARREVADLLATRLGRVEARKVVPP